MNRMRDRFNRIAARVTATLGSPLALLLAVAIIVVWAVTGPLFDFSDTWQLAINTGTTVVTFLMVFVIQNSQNRDSKAIHAKLDELIRAIESARNEFMDAEEEPERVLYRQIRELRALAQAEPQLADVISSRVAEIGSTETPGASDDRMDSGG
jgi:low affinity Fe/Cu permease